MNIMIKIVHLLPNLIDQSYQLIKNIYNNLKNQLKNNWKKENKIFNNFSLQIYARLNQSK